MIVFCLGNPGDEYAETRHNIGFMVADLLAARTRRKFARGGGSGGMGEYLFCEGRVGGRGSVIVKPMTYMNLVGEALDQLGRRFDAAPDRLIVVTDDFALDFGRIRIRSSGSDGGHNGLGSIIEHLGTQEFTRIRLGVGPLPPGSDPADFVLDRMDENTLLGARRLAKDGMAAVNDTIRHGVDKAASRYNRRPPASDDPPRAAADAERPREVE